MSTDYRKDLPFPARADAVRLSVEPPNRERTAAVSVYLIRRARESDRSGSKCPLSQRIAVAIALDQICPWDREREAESARSGTRNSTRTPKPMATCAGRANERRENMVLRALARYSARDRYSP